MTPLDPTRREALRVALDQLETAGFDEARWAEVIDLARACAAAVDAGRADEVEALTTQLSVAGFQAQVGHRLGARRASAPVVLPTKQTPLLPVVGAVCAIGIGALGWAIGGGIVAAGTVLFALFIFGVALAGTHGANQHRAYQHRANQHRATPAHRAGPAVDPRRPASPTERAALAELRRLVSPTA